MNITFAKENLTALHTAFEILDDGTLKAVKLKRSWKMTQTVMLRSMI